MTRVNADHSIIYQSVIWCSVMNFLDIMDYIHANINEIEVCGGNIDELYFGSNTFIDHKNSREFNDKSFKVGRGSLKKHSSVGINNGGI